MKGAFETMILFFFGMMFTCLLVYGGINIVLYQQARCYQEMIVASIEHNHGYDEEVKELLDMSGKICSKCAYSVYESDQNQFEYRLVIEYPILFPVLDYYSKGKLITYALIRSE